MLGTHLLHHPLCPLSRYVRLVLAEYGLEVRLVEERFWERREEFLLLNPAGEIPVLVQDRLAAGPRRHGYRGISAGNEGGRSRIDAGSGRRARRGAPPGELV